MAKTVWSFGHSECNRVNVIHDIQSLTKSVPSFSTIPLTFIGFSVCKKINCKFVVFSISVKNKNDYKNYEF